MSRFVGTKVQFGTGTDEFSLEFDTRELPLIHSDNRLNDFHMEEYLWGILLPLWE